MLRAFMRRSVTALVLALALVCAQARADRAPPNYLNPAVCLHELIKFLVLHKKTQVEYWESKLGRKLVEGEVLETKHFLNLVSVYRFNGQSVDWDFYVQSNRGLRTVKAFYPGQMLDPESLAGKKILDAGTGGGGFVKGLLQMQHETGLKFDVQGIDLSLSADLARDSEHFLKRDMSSTGFADDSFDVIFSTWSFFSYESQSNPEAAEKILHEFERILKPGGVIRISPVKPKVIEELVAKVPGLRFKASGWGRVQPDPNTLLTIGRWVEIEKPLREGMAPVFSLPASKAKLPGTQGLPNSLSPAPAP
jgi:ubiquinone/menaquinone biosynthesis C-methylase UbiE